MGVGCRCEGFPPPPSRKCSLCRPACRAPVRVAYPLVLDAWRLCALVLYSRDSLTALTKSSRSKGATLSVSDIKARTVSVGAESPLPSKDSGDHTHTHTHDWGGAAAEHSVQRKVRRGRLKPPPCRRCGTCAVMRSGRVAPMAGAVSHLRRCFLGSFCLRGPPTRWSARRPRGMPPLPGSLCRCARRAGRSRGTAATAPQGLRRPCDRPPCSWPSSTRHRCDSKMRGGGGRRRKGSVDRGGDGLCVCSRGQVRDRTARKGGRT